MKNLLLISALLVSAFTFAQPDSTTTASISQVSYTLNSGTVVVLQPGEGITFDVGVNYTYFTHTKAGEKKGKKYSGDDVSEIKIVRNGVTHLYHPYKALGSTTKLMLEELHKTRTLTLLGALPFENERNDQQLVVAYFVLQSKKNTPRMLPDNYQDFSATFACKPVKERFGKKKGEMTVADMIEAFDIYDKECLD